MGLSLDRQTPGTLMVATMNRWRPHDTIWRSTDDGEHWLRLNDDRHRYGQRFRTLAGDLQHDGRVYVATTGGVLFMTSLCHRIRNRIRCRPGRAGDGRDGSMLYMTTLFFTNLSKQAGK